MKETKYIVIIETRKFNPVVEPVGEYYFNIEDIASISQYENCDLFEITFVNGRKKVFSTNRYDYFRPVYNVFLEIKGSCRLMIRNGKHSIQTNLR